MHCLLSMPTQNGIVLCNLSCFDIDQNVKMVRSVWTGIKFVMENFTAQMDQMKLHALIGFVKREEGNARMVGHVF